MGDIYAKVVAVIPHADGGVVIRFKTDDGELLLRLRPREVSKLLEGLVATVPVVGTAS